MNLNRCKVLSLLVVAVFCAGGVCVADTIDLMDVDSPSFVGIEGGGEGSQTLSSLTASHVENMEGAGADYDPSSYFHEVDQLLNLCHIQDGLRRHGGEGQRGKVFALQNGLKRTGFYQGELTGDYDKETMLAANQMRMTLMKSNLHALGYRGCTVDGSTDFKAMVMAAKFLRLQNKQSPSPSAVINTPALRTLVTQRNAILLSRDVKPQVVKATKEHSARSWQRFAMEQPSGNQGKEDNGSGLQLDDVWRFLNSDVKWTIEEIR